MLPLAVTLALKQVRPAWRPFTRTLQFLTFRVLAVALQHLGNPVFDQLPFRQGKSRSIFRRKLLELN